MSVLLEYRSRTKQNFVTASETSCVVVTAGGRNFVVTRHFVKNFLRAPGGAWRDPTARTPHGMPRLARGLRSSLSRYPPPRPPAAAPPARPPARQSVCAGADRPGGCDVWVSARPPRHARGLAVRRCCAGRALLAWRSPWSHSNYYAFDLPVPRCACAINTLRTRFQTRPTSADRRDRLSLVGAPRDALTICGAPSCGTGLRSSSHMQQRVESPG